ncbi:MAG: Gfo/Idh/MocA family oxidoreductase [Deltaproteobacteria bacterium]|nr:Gfo/Idh/MocA family oxidoreductase [Deltaproteobacteria bacterium]
MRQLTQNLKDGAMAILEVPAPLCGKGQVLVRNHYSVISAGTEGKTVKDARSGYIGKARARQEEVRQVANLARTEGLSSTYKMVMNKLHAPSPLGYSCAGEVMGIGEGVGDLKIGDRVACGGGDAVHAEVVSVARNLCARIPEGMGLKSAAFATIGAIAMQGVRQSDLRLGENCVMIGLGLIGQLSIQLLNAAGVLTYGIDIDPGRVELAGLAGAALALERNRGDLEQIIMETTSGYGTDAVMITAGTSSLDPVELAGALCRKKGKVIVVGGVPTGFSRENYYKKELDLRMSSSYGPGRYDPTYEEKGLDYPYGYVRWTENRNMQAYLQLLKDGKLNMDKLITHEFEFQNAPQAYQMILDKDETYCGIVLQYDTAKEQKQGKVKIASQPLDIGHGPCAVRVGFIGAGSFAQNFLLPNLTRSVEKVGVATAHGETSRHAADKYGFKYATGDADEIISDENINTVFIATRHNLHAEYVLKALKAGKHVFVEKPLCLTMQELKDIVEVYTSQSGTPNSKSIMMVGYNRRFSPLIQKLKEILPADIPKAIHYRINAGSVAPDHWIHDKEIGGGRIIGEICHFIDLAMYIADDMIASVSATMMESSMNLMDTLAINVSFKNGGIASISYFSNGSKSLNKEYIEVFCANQVVAIDDFKKMIFYAKGKKKFGFRKQEKGHAQEVRQFLKAAEESGPCPIPFDNLYTVSITTFKAVESIHLSETLII